MMPIPEFSTVLNMRLIRLGLPLSESGLTNVNLKSYIFAKFDPFRFRFVLSIGNFYERHTVKHCAPRGMIRRAFFAEEHASCATMIPSRCFLFIVEKHKNEKWKIQEIVENAEKLRKRSFSKIVCNHAQSILNISYENLGFVEFVLDCSQRIPAKSQEKMHKACESSFFCCHRISFIGYFLQRANAQTFFGSPN